jgi:hypothetical protein
MTVTLTVTIPMTAMTAKTQNPKTQTPPNLSQGWSFLPFVQGNA